MGEKKTKIVLDADVINHFVRGGKLSLLPKIFPEFQYIVLDVVKKELPMLILSELIKQISHGIDIREELFNVSGEAKKEYFRLTATNGLHLGKGESACMVYCKFHNDVVGSSNTRDITNYCNEHGITYLTTNDFLFYAIQRGLLKKEEAEDFIRIVICMGSNPPKVDFDQYVCSKI